MAEFVHHFKSVLTALFFAGGMSGGSIASDVVSTSLCGDAYVLALAPENRIKALSWQSSGPLSMASSRYHSLPKAQAESEVLLALAPEAIVLGPGDANAATRLARLRGTKVHSIAWQDSFAGISSNMIDLGSFLGEPERASKFVDEQRTKLQELEARASDRTKIRNILYLTPTLGTAGSGTFIDAAILAAGAENLATELGIAGWGQVPLERLAGVQPDLVISSFFIDGPSSVLQFRSRHSLLRALHKRVPEMTIPGKLWVCAGPGLIEAASLIADELDVLEGRKKQ